MGVSLSGRMVKDYGLRGKGRTRARMEGSDRLGKCVCGKKRGKDGRLRAFFYFSFLFGKSCNPDFRHHGYT